MAVKSAPPKLSTERLILRLLEESDLAAVLNYYRVNKEHLEPYGPSWPEGYFTEAFWQKQVKRNLEEFYMDQSCRMFIFEQKGGELVGTVSFGGILRGAAQFCYLGYGLASDKQGKGYMYEAILAALDFAFNELKLHRVMANYIPTNERSGRLLKRLGFAVEGYARDYLHLNGKWQDHILTSLTNPRWSPGA